jgi:hypothetical protein
MTSEIQSVVFLGNAYSPSQQRAWLREHHLHPIKPAHHVRVHGKGREGHVSTRWRLHYPSDFDHFRTRVLNPHIHLILGWHSKYYPPTPGPYSDSLKS